MVKKTHRNAKQSDVPEMSEDVLISRMKADETEAYKYFFWEYCDYINLLTCSLLENQEDAKTVMRQVMRDVWTKRHDDWLKLPLKPFLYQEVYRRCVPYMGGEKRRSLLHKLFRR